MSNIMIIIDRCRSQFMCEFKLELIKVILIKIYDTLDHSPSKI